MGFGRLVFFGRSRSHFGSRFGIAPFSPLAMPPKQVSSVFVAAFRDRHFVRLRIHGEQYDGPLRAAENAAKKDVRAIKAAPTDEQVNVLDSRRTDAGMDPVRRERKIVPTCGTSVAVKQSPRLVEPLASSTSTPAKARRQTLVGGAKSPRAASNTGTPARTPARTPRTPHGNRNVYMKCFQRVHQFWLEQRRGPRRNQEPDESTLARQFARHRIQDLSDPKYAATREKLAEIEKKEADARDWELADAPVAATEQRMQAEHDAWCRGQRRDPEPRPLLRREAGKHAYPGLLNLGQTCYLGSVIQCLIHCGAARAVLQDQPAAAPQDGVATLPLALQSLAAECVHGVSLPTDAGLRPDFRAGVDLYSPHAVIDVFADVSGFVVGSNYDACEAPAPLPEHGAPQ